MEVTPVGYVVLVEPEKVKETVGQSKIVVITPDKKKLEEQAQVRGIVLAIGELAWEEYTERDLLAPVQIGDVVYFQRHAGMRLTDENGTVRMDRLLLKDTDIVAVVNS